MLDKSYHIVSRVHFSKLGTNSFSQQTISKDCPDFRQERFASQLLTGEPLGQFLGGNQALSEQTRRGLR